MASGFFIFYSGAISWFSGVNPFVLYLTKFYRPGGVVLEPNALAAKDL